MTGRHHCGGSEDTVLGWKACFVERVVGVDIALLAATVLIYELE